MIYELFIICRLWYSLFLSQEFVPVDEMKGGDTICHQDSDSSMITASQLTNQRMVRNINYLCVVCPDILGTLSVYLHAAQNF